MCGIFGVVDAAPTLDIDLLVRGTRALEHRGPDAEGFLLAHTRDGRTATAFSLQGERHASPPRPEGAFDIGFGFRRLAIIDTSNRGNQPMSTMSGDSWIVFNGEIYNYVELRSELQSLGHTFRTGTDTEVLLVAYSAWGQAFVERLIGMWAFALWDPSRRELICSRDRFGIKPFYYTVTPRGLRFASEIKALLEDSDVRRSVCTPRMVDFLVTGRINHTAQTLFDGVLQLPPATIAVWDLTDVRRPPEIGPYWALDPSASLRGRTDAAYAAETHDRMAESIRLHLRSDVPVGTCLSGGIDSSAIVGLVNKTLVAGGLTAAQLGDRQRTFSSCSDDPRFDERTFSHAVVEKTGAEENLIFPSADGLVSDLPDLIWHQDEPFGSTSMYAQWCVFRRAAERGVKVMLDGQGGDELFAGYQGYDRFLFLSLVQHGHLIRALREGYAASSGDLLGGARWFAATAATIWGKGIRTSIRRMLRRPGAAPAAWFDADALAEHHVVESWKERSFPDVFQERLYRELRDGLPGLLRYEDRDSMAFSIEARVPFLDHRLVEFAFALPPDQKIRDGVTKYVLREAMRAELPDVVRNRRDKMGFVTPESTWFRTHLAARARDVLADPPASVASLVRIDDLRGLAARATSEDLPPYEQTVLWRVLNSCEWTERFSVR
jgi:asparagine synthase (glutamine-hydrolysing)